MMKIKEDVDLVLESIEELSCHIIVVGNHIEVQPSMMAMRSSTTAVAQSHHKATQQGTRVETMKL